MHFSKFSSVGILTIGLMAISWPAVAYEGFEIKNLDLQPTVSESGVPHQETIGTWQARGYGILFEITETGIRYFHYTDNVCFEETEPAWDVFSRSSFFQVEDPGRKIIFARHPTETPYVYDRVDAVPAHCKPAVFENATPEQVYTYFRDVMTVHYPFFSARNFDWDARVDEAERKLPTIQGEEELWQLLTGMVDGLNDAHTRLIRGLNESHGGEGNLETFRTNRPRFLDTLEAYMQKNDVQGTPRSFYGGEIYPHFLDSLQNDFLDGSYNMRGHARIIWKTLEGNIGYIFVRQMGGFSDDIDDPDLENMGLKEILDEVMVDLQGARALIVDMSLNGGGYDSLARKIAERLAHEKTLAHTKIAFRAEGVEPASYFLEPSPDQPGFKGPVYVFQSELSASAAENFLLSILEMQNVTTVGETSLGIFSDVIRKELPNGWVLWFGNEVFRGPDGVVYEGPGVPPERTLPVFSDEDLPGSYVRALRRLLKMVQEETKPTSG